MSTELIVKNLSSLIEEEVLVSSGNIEFVVFANICPYKLEVGEKHLVDLGLVFLDELNFEELSEAEEKIERIDDSFGYKLRGKLKNETLQVLGLEFECDDFEGMDYLDGKWIEVEVDRIGAEFKNKITQ